MQVSFGPRHPWPSPSPSGRLQSQKERSRPLVGYERFEHARSRFCSSGRASSKIETSLDGRDLSDMTHDVDTDNAEEIGRG